MIPAVLMLYGPYAQHPWQEDMFHRPDKIQADLAKLGFGFDIAMAVNAPTGKDEIPEVRIARNPVYDQQTGTLLEAHFRPGSIEEYPSIIDHWVANFQAEVLQADGTYQRTAYGIGLPPDRLWNHKSIQRFGNHKDLMDEVIAAHGVGIPTYRVLDYDQFADAHGSDSPIIYKPQGGSRAVGVEVFDDVQGLRHALESSKLATNGHIQPYLRTMQPIQGVVPATKSDAELLKRYNAKADRPREIRMYVITTTNERGNLQTEAYPVMKISYPNHKFMHTKLHIGIDPATLGKGTWLHDKSIELAQAVCRAAGQPGQPTPQYYGVFDWLVDGDVHNPDDVRVGDGNCRGPGIRECATAARDALQRALVYTGKKYLS